jgi:hypothetical protein
MVHRIAILLSGHLRTWEKCVNSVRDTIVNLETNGFVVDVFMSTYSNRYGYHPYIQGVLNFYEDVSIDNKNFPDVNNIVNITIGNDRVDTSDFHPNMKDIYHGYSQYNTLESALNSALVYEHRNNFEYDIIIKTRFDVMLNPYETINAVSECLSNSREFVISSSGQYPSDFTFISRRNNMVELPSYIKSMYISPSSELCWYQPPHGLLLQYFSYKKLDVKCMAICSNVIRV